MNAPYIRTRTLLLGAALGLGTPACKDPAQNVTAAKVEAVTTAAAAPAKPQGAWEIEPGSSRIQFIGSKVTGKHQGEFKRFSGWAYVEDTNINTAQLYIEIDIRSVDTDTERLTKHLKEDDFFATSSYPTGSFQLTQLTPNPGPDGTTHTATGKLRLRGVEKIVSFPVKLTLSQDSLNAAAEFKINRKDWNINYAGKKNDLIRDEVIIQLQVNAKRSV